MAYDLSSRLVIGIASSALFDLTESGTIFQNYGEDAYRRHQEENAELAFPIGVAFPFIRRLLSLNDLSPMDDPLVEVIVLSRNDPDTGLRVLHSTSHYELSISRAIFTQGKSPHQFIPALNMSLFLSANPADVREAVDAGFPAGQVMSPILHEEDSGSDLRIAFDFDGVLADDGSERIFKLEGLDGFQSHEAANSMSSHNPGPLKNFLASINRIQLYEEEMKAKDASYQIRVRVALVTARNAPAHARAVNSLKKWGLRVNDGFFLGGIEKALVLKVLQPHIFFDDQLAHVTSASKIIPSVHIPFGVRNEPPEMLPGNS